ncbi:MAG: DUF5110 domain-containing protein [Muribaculaceae bacterium]|nr:DUF5110 domain-containing protein [Muribaculaceae bacterium]
MKTFALLALPLFASAAFAVTAPAPGSIATEGKTTLISTPKGTVAVTPVTPDIFRISQFPAGIPALDFPKSQSAILAPQDFAISSFATPTEYVVSTPSTILKVNRLTGKISFENAAGETLLSEDGGIDNSGKLKSVTFVTPDASFYGAGERGHSLRLNGDSLPMWNRPTYGYGAGDSRINQMNITMPVILAENGVGILFDDYNQADLTIGKTIRYTSETPKPLSYYFINGNGSLAGATTNYTALTGRQDLPPFWTLGYITSKYGYKSQDEALGVIDSLKRNGYPVDGLVFDLYWYGVETDMGRLEWNKELFPNPKGMLDSLNSMQVNTILIHQPYINKKGAIDNYNILDAASLLTHDASGNTNDVTTWVGDAGMFDISNPDTREWLWNRLKELTDDGLAGWWGDLGEPEVHPLTIVHDNGEKASEYHNVYGNEWSRLVYEGLRKDFPDMRPMLLMRGGTSGLQRYSVFPWSGDVGRSWEGLQAQIPIMLNSGLSGLGYMSSDIGGFAVDPKNPTNPELYVRWVQMGVFTPVLRTHAQAMPEPYHYEGQQDILRKFINMRYEWLPYNYTLAYENAAKGLPLARPLNFREENRDAKYADVEDEYLWGDEVLVAPVMTEGARQRKVLFPAGEWIDWNNPALRYKGGSTAVVKAPLNTLPLFVKAGSFIPQYLLPMKNVEDYNPAFLTVKYFPSDKETSFTLFDDNRKSPVSLETNDYQLTTFKGRSADGTTVISISAEGKYEGMPEGRNLTIEIPGVKKPSAVEMSNGIRMEEAVSLKAIRLYGWSYDAAKKTLFVRFPYDYKDLTVTVK